ncbi:phosphatase domain-containing protein [Fulvivirga ligni]|uniref:phosphatase domain-containing protein n=1 Tax=Fulvivirga ligni TaxID=2904246 RepID=UPI001F2237D6|nr:phosphatase domain-containing protein [Fulvivirga ligni]UII23622.1 DUF2183 domain-containing protein [Fulvivirga ligni]
MSRLKKAFIKSESGIDILKFKIKEKLNLASPVFIYPYRGFGTPELVHLHGRILEKEAIIHEPSDRPDTTWTNLKKVWKRYESDEVPGVEVKGVLYGEEATAVSDDEGYFTLRFEKLDPAKLINGWHTVDLEITDMPFDLDFIKTASAEVIISDEQKTFGIISDIDDTIIQSDILKPLKMISNVLFKDAKKRVPFEGVQELYVRLSKNYLNPLLFVTGSSYNLFDMLTEFCEHHGIPKAPFIMRDLGFGPDQWLKQDSQEYKKQSIELILNIFPHLNFILIGDSGEKDPEIYLDIHQCYPGRVMAIYIRHVHSDLRRNEIDERVKDLDIPFLLMQDSQEAIDHAAERGWI